MSRKRKQASCAAVADTACAKLIPSGSPDSHESSYFETVNRILARQRAVPPLEETERFVEAVLRAIRQREVVSKHWSRITGHEDIISLIHSARESGDTNEAIWRCFLAAHFGRPSAQGDHQIQSASRILCAFCDTPFWTWKRVSKNTEVLREWLFECADDLETLRYGSHRKYESQKPELIWSVIESFVSLANEYGSPMRLITVDEDEPIDEFDILYRRLRPVTRFGRTGRFDFLVLLLDLGLISAEPRSCYLRGATGPLQGAKLLWGERLPKELDEMAAELSERLDVSPIVMEDALCNWQK
ncbi:MAG: hypothetical protein IH899_18970 [Planctomycetes bacterium]|nr:hypothetical protein [Planctomycetota bacterium]